MQTVTKGHFKNSNDNNVFPDSQIAKMLTLGADETRYIINYGIAPYFYEIFKASVNLVGFYVISFDKSMNPITQTNEMDCLIRYRDSEANLIKVQFWNSSYLGHRTHKDVLEKSENSLTDLIHQR